MKKFIFSIIIILIFLMVGNSYALETIIGIKNISEKKMTFKVSYETHDNKRYTFNHEATLKPNESYEFLTHRRVRVHKGGWARVEVKGSEEGFSLTGGLVERSWGNLSKEKYLRANIKKNENEVGIYISIK